MANQYNYVALDKKGKIVAYTLTKWEARLAASKVGGTWRPEKPPELAAQMKDRGTWNADKHEQPRRYSERRLTRPDLTGRELSKLVPHQLVVVPKDVPQAPPKVPDEVQEAKAEIEEARIEPPLEQDRVEVWQGAKSGPDCDICEDLPGRFGAEFDYTCGVCGKRDVPEVVPEIVVPKNVPVDPPKVPDEVQEAKAEIKESESGTDALPGAVLSAADFEPEQEYEIHEHKDGRWQLSAGPFSGFEFLPGEVLHDYFALAGHAVVPVKKLVTLGFSDEKNQPIRSASEVEPDQKYLAWGKGDNGYWKTAGTKLPGTVLLPGGALHFMLPSAKTKQWKTCYTRADGDPNQSSVSYGDPFEPGDVSQKELAPPQRPAKVEFSGKTMICDCCKGNGHDDRPCEVCGHTQYTVICDTCSGKGAVTGKKPEKAEPVPCELCDGKKVVDCWACAGVGFKEKGDDVLPCETCETKGQVECDSCDGRGVVPPLETKAKKITTTCPDCEGEKRVAVPEKALLDAACPTCGSEGKVDGRACPECEGLGISESLLKKEHPTLEPCSKCKDAKCPCCMGQGVLLSVSGEPLDRVRKQWDPEQAGQYRTWRMAQARVTTKA